MEKRCASGLGRSLGRAVNQVAPRHMPIGRSTNRSETSKKCTTKDLQDWLVHFNGKTHGIAARLAYTDRITGQVQNMRIELKERPIQTSNNALHTMRRQSKLKEIKQNKYLPVALRWCNLASGNLSEVCTLRRFTGGGMPPIKRGAIVLPVELETFMEKANGLKTRYDD